MICSKCNSETKDGSKFCMNCGSKIPNKEIKGKKQSYTDFHFKQGKEVQTKVNLWRTLNINTDVDSTDLLQEIDISIQSGVISDKYSIKYDLKYDSKYFHEKIINEMYDNIYEDGNVLNFKFYLYFEKCKEWDITSEIRHFNSLTSRYRNNYFINYIEEKGLVEGYFVRKRKGFLGFLLAPPSELELEEKFRNIYFMCKQIKVL